MIQNITDDEKKQIESDGGVSLNQLNAALLKRGIKPSAKITEKFHELDTNKDGLLEKSEVTSAAEAEDGGDYFFGIIAALIAAAAGAVGAAGAAAGAATG